MLTARRNLGSHLLFAAMVAGVMVIAVLFAERLLPEHFFLGHFG